MTLKLYWARASPPARAVVFCAKELGIDLELLEMDLVKNDHQKPEYLKMNPQHTIPVLDDDGFIICDSHATMAYLVRKYNKGGSLYPEDLKKRAIIDHRLHFDSGTLFQNHLRVCKPIVLEGAKAITEDSKKALLEAYGVMEIFLQKSEYIAGDDLTIADLSLWTTISNVTVYLPLNGKYPNIAKWMELMQKRPYNEINEGGREDLRELMKPFFS